MIPTTNENEKVVNKLRNKLPKILHFESITGIGADQLIEPIRSAILFGDEESILIELGRSVFLFFPNCLIPSPDFDFVNLIIGLLNFENNQIVEKAIILLGYVYVNFSNHRQVLEENDFHYFVAKNLVSSDVISILTKMMKANPLLINGILDNGFMDEIYDMLISNMGNQKCETFIALLSCASLLVKIGIPSICTAAPSMITEFQDFIKTPCKSSHYVLKFINSRVECMIDTINHLRLYYWLIKRFFDFEAQSHSIIINILISALQPSTVNEYVEYGVFSLVDSILSDDLDHPYFRVQNLAIDLLTNVLKVDNRLIGFVLQTSLVDTVSIILNAGQIRESISALSFFIYLLHFTENSTVKTIFERINIVGFMLETLEMDSTNLTIDILEAFIILIRNKENIVTLNNELSNTIESHRFHESINRLANLESDNNRISELCEVVLSMCYNKI